MRLVTTAGGGSMDLYAERLGAHLAVPTLRLDVRSGSPEVFGHPLWSPRTWRAAVSDLSTLRALRQAGGALHLAHHHLARFVPLLPQPCVVTVHDLMRHRDARGGSPFIASLRRRDRLLLRRDVAGIRGAAAVIAVSHATRDDLATGLDIDPERITVVHHGVDHRVFRPVAVRPRGRHLLVVGSEHPRKNLDVVIRALAALTSDARFADLRLLKVGPPGTDEADFRGPLLNLARKLHVDDRIEFAGEVSEEALAACYSSAMCCITVSAHEGFGMVPLEAMACGCPVIASTGGALPEIVGDAGLLVTPGAVRELRDAIIVLSDPVRQRDLRCRGLRRAAAFTWERAAADTAAVYERVVRARSAQPLRR